MGYFKDCCVNAMQFFGWGSLLFTAPYTWYYYPGYMLLFWSSLFLIIFLENERCKWIEKREDAAAALEASDPKLFKEANKLDPKVAKEIRAKEALRNTFLDKLKNNFIDDGELPDPRVPGGVIKGQKWAMGDKWPLIDIRTEKFEFKADDSYSLRVTGCGEDGTQETSISLQELRDMAQDYEDINMHCVTTCSARGLKFRGVPWHKVVAKCNPPSGWTWMTQFGRDGYSTNVPREEVMLSDIAEPFIAIGMYDKHTDEYTEGLPYDHGVVRPFFPRLYGWKGCKWLTGIRFDMEMVHGFWELSGAAHNRGRVDLQERFDYFNWKGEGHETMTYRAKAFHEMKGCILMFLAGAQFRLPIIERYAVWTQRVLGEVVKAGNRRKAAKLAKQKQEKKA